MEHLAVEKRRAPRWRRHDARAPGSAQARRVRSVCWTGRWCGCCASAWSRWVMRPVGGVANVDRDENDP